MFCLLRFHYYYLLWSIDRIYDAAPKMFKIFDSAAVDSSGGEDEMDYLSKSSGGETDWWFFCGAANCIKILQNYIMGLNQKPWNTLNLEYFRLLFVHLEEFYLLTASYLLFLSFDVKTYILKDLTLRVEVREVILYLLLTEV